MKNNLKQLRKFDNLKVLLISADDKYNDELSKLFSNISGFKIATSDKDALSQAKDIDFDVVLVNDRDNNFKTILAQLDRIGEINLKIIISNSNNSDDLVVDAINSNVYTVLTKPFDIVNVKLSIVMALNQSNRGDKINLGEGFYFDTYRDRVYNKKSEAVDFTKLELGLLKLILEMKGQIVDYDMIEKRVWKNRKMSIFTMRNVVSKIRIKTYYDIFKNASSKGYIIG